MTRQYGTIEATPSAEVKNAWSYIYTAFIVCVGTFSVGVEHVLLVVMRGHDNFSFTTIFK